jgi:hypothetical protein
MHPAPEELIAVSGFIAKKLLKNHSVRPAHIIPNGIDEISRSPLPMKRETYMGESARVILQLFGYGAEAGAWRQG